MLYTNPYYKEKTMDNAINASHNGGAWEVKAEAVDNLDNKTIEALKNALNAAEIDIKKNPPNNINLKLAALLKTVRQVAWMFEQDPETRLIHRYCEDLQKAETKKHVQEWVRETQNRHMPPNADELFQRANNHSQNIAAAMKLYLE